MVAKRFTDQVGIQPQNLSTGFVQGSNSLLNRIQSFKRSTDALTNVVETARGEKEAQQAIAEGKPFKKKDASIAESVLTGGVATAQYNKSLETAYLSGIGRDAKEAINAIEAENPNNIAQFNDKAQGYISGVLKEADPSVRGKVSEYLESTVSNSRMRVHRNTIQKNKADAAAESASAVTSFGNESARLSREGNQVGAAEQMLSAFETIDAMVEAGDLRADQASKMKREINRESTEQKIRGDFDATIKEDGPQVAFEELIKIENEVPKGWTPDEWDTFIKSEKASIGQELAKMAQLSSQLTIDQTREISNLKIQASTGTGDAGEIVQRTETLFNDGTISGAERTSILTNVINQQKSSVKKSADFSAVAERLAGNEGIVIDNSVIDQFYEEQMQEPLSQVPVELKAQQQALFVDKMKRVPTAMKNEITTQLRSGNPELIAEASNLIDMIDETPGLIDRTFTAHDRAFAEQVVSLSANLEPAEAVRIANELTDPTNQSRIQAVEATIKNDKLADEYPSIVQDAYNPIGPFQGTQVGEVALPQMTREYKDLFETHFKAGMTESAAKEKAIALLKRNWKKSEVTGKVMKYAPDDYYTVAGDVSYIKEQLAKDVNDEFLFEESVKSDQIFLQATEDTARTASQGEPEYRVMIVKDGSITPLYGLSWKPDMQKQIDKVEKENQSVIDKRRGQGKVAAENVIKSFSAEDSQLLKSL